MGDPLEDSFSFGFNDSSFSDRVLRIEIMSESVHDRKRRREVSEEENGECSPLVQVKTLHINSLILAARSPFFYKLFKNAMIESQQKHVTLKIKASEEGPLMQVLRFMYSNTLNPISGSELLNVLMAADKFEVSSCVSYCSKMMQKLPMSLESSVLYLDLPSSLLAREAVKQLIDATKKYLVACYGDLTKLDGEAVSLPLSVVEVVLSSDNIKVRSEDDVLDFVLNWVRAQYPNLEERREVLESHLLRLVRFPYLSFAKLKEVRFCPDFHHDHIRELVSDALFHKVDHDDLPAGSSGFVLPRGHQKTLPVKIVRLGLLDRPSVVVYLELKEQDVHDMIESQSTKEFVSETFMLGPRRVSLHPMVCNIPGLPPCQFDISLCVDRTCNLDCRVSAMFKSTKEFESHFSVHNFTAQGGTTNTLPSISYCRSNMALHDETTRSRYFINGVLCIRVYLILNDVIIEH